MDVISMRRMKINQMGTIKSIAVTGEMGRRIREMGLVPGARIMIVGRAPLYDPVAVKLRGYTLTLRNSEADYIQVELPEN